MPLAANFFIPEEDNDLWVSPSSGIEMPVIEVPFAGVKGSWEDNLLAATPRTDKENPVLGYGRYFDKPTAPASKKFTLLLGNRWELRAARSAIEFAKSRPIWPASPYHVFEAIKHVGGFNTQPWWDGDNGPGVVIPTKAKWRQEIICIWYRSLKDKGGAQVQTFGRSFSNSVTPFVMYNWKPAS